jgi:hypothetical protein
MEKGGRRKRTVGHWVAVLLVGILAGSVMLTPAGAHLNSPLTFKHLKKHFYTKKGANSAFINVGEKASDSDKLDGTDSTGFVKTGQVLVAGNAGGRNNPIDDFLSADFTSIISTSITAPATGFLFIVGTVSIEDDASFAGSGKINYRLRVDTTAVDSNTESNDLETDIDTAVIFGNSGATSAVVPISAGAHTIHLDAREFGTGSFIEGRSISVLFTPSGSGVTIPLRVGKRASSSSQ